MPRRLRNFMADDSGAAAIEMAGVGTLLIIGLMNAAEIGRYAYQAQNVNHAAQAGAEAALVACDIDHTPATQNCSGLQSAVTAAIQGTALGRTVQLNGGLTEGYYCRTNGGGLGLAGPVSNPPDDCSGVANAAGGADPALYLSLTVQYIWQPLFSGLTLARTFNPYITRSAWMRMK